MSNKQQILNHSILYGSATQITQAILVVAGLLSRNFLGPVQMGVWATLQIILQYMSYTTLGTTQGILREIPYNLGKGLPQRAETIKNVVVSYQIVIASALAMCVFTVAILFRLRMTVEFFWGLIAVSILIVVQRLDSLLIALLRAHKQFELASKQMILSAIVNVILIVILAYPFKILGFMAAMILSFLFNIAYNMMHYKFRFHFEFSSKIWSIIKFGLPLLLITVLNGIFKSIDKIMIVKMIGLKELGLYSVAVLASTLLSNLPNALGVIMLPHFHQKYGERDRAEDVKGYVQKGVIAFSNLMAILIGLSWFALPIFIPLLLPDYVEGARSAQYLIIGTYFFALSLPIGHVLITLKKHFVMFPILAFTLTTAAALNLIAIKYGFGIRGVAMATSVSLGIYFICIFKKALPHLFSKTEAIALTRHWMGRFIYIITCIVAIEHLISMNTFLITMSMRLLAISILILPIAYYLNREYEVLETIKKRISFKPFI